MIYAGLLVLSRLVTRTDNKAKRRVSMVEGAETAVAPSSSTARYAPGGLVGPNSQSTRQLRQIVAHALALGRRATDEAPPVAVLFFSVEGLAHKRGSTPATIVTQIKSALRKTGAENRAELIRQALVLAVKLRR